MQIARLANFPSTVETATPRYFSNGPARANRNACMRPCAKRSAGRDSVKGEITLVAGPPRPVVTEASDAAILAALASMPAAKAAAEIARRFNTPRKEIYARILALKDND